MVNQKNINDYFDIHTASVAKQILKLINSDKEADLIIKVSGGGKRGQAEAIRLGLARLFVKIDTNIKPSLKAKNYLTRDARVKERKKPGLKRARRAPQWSKR